MCQFQAMEFHITVNFVSLQRDFLKEPVHFLNTKGRATGCYVITLLSFWKKNDIDNCMIANFERQLSKKSSSKRGRKNVMHPTIRPVNMPRELRRPVRGILPSSGNQAQYMFACMFARVRLFCATCCLSIRRTLAT